MLLPLLLIAAIHLGAFLRGCDPAHCIATDGESRDFAGECQCRPRLDQASAGLLQLLLTLDTCKHKRPRWKLSLTPTDPSPSSSPILNTPCPPSLTLEHSHQEKPSQSGLHGECLCGVRSLSGTAGSPWSGAPVSELLVRLVFMSRRRALFACCAPI